MVLSISLLPTRVVTRRIILDCGGVGGRVMDLEKVMPWYCCAVEFCVSAILIQRVTQAFNCVGAWAHGDVCAEMRVWRFVYLDVDVCFFVLILFCLATLYVLLCFVC